MFDKVKEFIRRLDIKEILFRMETLTRLYGLTLIRKQLVTLVMVSESIRSSWMPLKLRRNGGELEEEGVQVILSITRLVMVSDSISEKSSKVTLSRVMSVIFKSKIFKTDILLKVMTYDSAYCFAGALRFDIDTFSKISSSTKMNANIL